MGPTATTLSGRPARVAASRRIGRRTRRSRSSLWILTTGAHPAGQERGRVPAATPPDGGRASLVALGVAVAIFDPSEGGNKARFFESYLFGFSQRSTSFVKIASLSDRS
jgi:hypothetical protein